MREPCRIVVLTAEGCPHCRAVLGEMQRLSRACGTVHVRQVDLAHAPELASRFNVRSVPAVIVDDELCLEGRVGAEELAALLAARRSPGFEAKRCRALLEHGRLADAAMRVTTSEGARVIAELLAAPELSMRMGAQLAIRQAFERDPHAVARLMPDLVALIASPDPAVRGDVADLLGAVGDATVAASLAALAEHDDDADVREAAQEALAQLTERGERCC